MTSSKIRKTLQAILLSGFVATAMVPGAAAQTPKELLGMVKAGAVVGNRAPASTLPTKQLLRQRKILARFVFGKVGSAKLRRKAITKLRLIDIELRNRNITVPASPKKFPGAGTGQKGAQQNQAAMQVLTDRRPSGSLSVRQLQQRIKDLREIILDPTVARIFVKLARNMRKNDLAELRNRNGVIRPPQFFAVLRDRRPSASLPTPQLRERIRKLNDVIAATANRPKQRARAKNMHALDIRELKNRSRVVRPGKISPQLNKALKDQRTSQSLNRRQLNRRIEMLARLMTSPRISKRHKKTVKILHARDVAELNRRLAERRPPVAQNYPVLQDRRPAYRLKSNELRGRIAALRDILRQPKISRPVRKQLKRKLVADRTELRRRVAEKRAREAGETTQPVVPNPPRVRVSDQARRLLNDYRSSRALNKSQLNTRIRAARNVLKFVALTPYQRAQVKDMIKRDRAEKSRRLIAARDRRRAKLDRLRQGGNLRIEINPRVIPQPYGNRRQNRDLAAAEADEGMIQRKFLEPEPRTFQRRYSREEIVRRPDLTRQFAGIDVDTVNFGFNEYWIREEEVDELERMAVTIERILAARPYEVFQIEGHTDAVGSDAYNLKLSRQRAEAVKDALTKFFVIPARALVTIGLGERYLKIPTPDAESENRRVTIRRITPILRR